MAPERNKKPRKLKTILLAPFLAIGFFIGWILYVVGDKQVTKQQKKSTPINQDNIQLMMIPQEEQTIKS